MRIGMMLRHVAMRGGIGTYTRNLLDHLLAQSPGDAFFLYYAEKSELGRYAGRPNVKERVVTSSSKLAWDQAAFPAAAAKDKVDVVFNTKLSVPLRGPVPSVFVLHGPEVYVAPQAYSHVDRMQARILYPFYARKAAAVMTHTQDSKDKLVRFLRIDPACIHVIPPGVGPEFRPIAFETAEAARARYRLPSRFFLFAGGLYPIKNFHRLVKALRQVKDRSGRRHAAAGRPRLPAMEGGPRVGRCRQPRPERRHPLPRFRPR